MKTFVNDDIMNDRFLKELRITDFGNGLVFAHMDPPEEPFLPTWSKLATQFPSRIAELVSAIEIVNPDYESVYVVDLPGGNGYNALLKFRKKPLLRRLFTCFKNKRYQPTYVDY